MNAITHTNPFPIPIIDAASTMLGGKRYFASLNLKSGHHYMPLDPATQEIASSSRPFRLFGVNRLPFGLTNAPADFQSMMQEIFGHLMYQYVMVYLNDIAIYSGEDAQHQKHVQEVLQRLTRHGFVLSPTKCVWGAREIHYRKNVGKALRAPVNTTEVRSFIDVVTCSKRYIPAFVRMTSPLHELASEQFTSC